MQYKKMIVVLSAASVMSAPIQSPSPDFGGHSPSIRVPDSPQTPRLQSRFPHEANLGRRSPGADRDEISSRFSHFKDDEVKDGTTPMEMIDVWNAHGSSCATSPKSRVETEQSIQARGMLGDYMKARVSKLNLGGAGGGGSGATKPANATKPAPSSTTKPASSSTTKPAASSAASALSPKTKRQLRNAPAPASQSREAGAFPTILNGGLAFVPGMGAVGTVAKGMGLTQLGGALQGLKQVPTKRSVTDSEVERSSETFPGMPSLGGLGGGSSSGGGMTALAGLLPPGGLGGLASLLPKAPTRASMVDNTEPEQRYTRVQDGEPVE